MLTRDQHNTSEEQQKPAGQTTGRTEDEQAALKRHEEVVAETKQLMIEWIFLLSINFITHFMRMSVVMIYCTQRFEASAFQVGLLVTIHMLVMGVANTYMCHAIDNYSFESLMILRFSLLALATLGEYLAESFELFAVVYAVASLAVVWFGVQTAYCVQVLPPLPAKLLTNIGLMINQFGVVIGLSLGGWVGGLIGIRAVFLLSCVIACLSLLWIVLHLRGKEQKIRHAQSTEIRQIYRDFPSLFLDSNLRFPMVFLDYIRENDQQMTGIKTTGDQSSMTAGIGKSPASLGVTTADVSETSPILKVNNSAENNQNGKSSSFPLFSSISVPFWLITLRHGINAAAITEAISWWNLYSAEVLDGPLQQSSMQFVVAILSSLLVSIVSIRLMKPQSMSFELILNVGSMISVIGSVVTALIFFELFPYLVFDQFWFGLPIVQSICGLTFPLSNTLQVAESPAQSAGKMFAVLTASRSIIPAIQHVIIGRLWSVGGANHPWFFRWFGILHLSSGVAMLIYWLSRKQMKRNQERKIFEKHTQLSTVAQQSQ